jgi:hAT family C-terminal dimerisation region
VAHGINEAINSESEECSSNSDDDKFTLGLGLNKASKRRPAADALDSPQSIQARKREQLKMEIWLELEVYLSYAASTAEDITDPIAWWKERWERFPKVAVWARKWLSVCSILTPSKQVLSICGVVNTARRNCLNGDSITAQVIIHNNLLDVDIHYLCTLLH